MLKFKKYIAAFSFLLPCFPVFLLLLLFQACPTFAEWYSSRVFPVLSYPAAKAASWFSGSFTEALILAAPLLLIGALVLFLVTLVRSHRKKHTLKRWVQWSGWVLSVAVLMFFLFHGYNYYRVPLSERMGLDTSSPKTAEDVERVCLLLANEANSERALLNADENGNMLLTETISETFSHADSGFAVVSETLLPLPGVYARPKAVRHSYYWSYTGITGMYFPLTLEANINVDIPQWTLPDTICHELSHTLGYAREEDASFLSFLACIHHPSADYRYSGYLSAFLECVKALKEYDNGMWEEAWSCLTDDVRRDIQQNSSYWRTFEGKVQEVSTAVNDAFLKVNQQSGGVLHYSQVAGQIISYYS